MPGRNDLAHRAPTPLRMLRACEVLDPRATWCSLLWEWSSVPTVWHQKSPQLISFKRRVEFVGFSVCGGEESCDIIGCCEGEYLTCVSVDGGDGVGIGDVPELVVTTCIGADSNVADLSEVVCVVVRDEEGVAVGVFSSPVFPLAVVYDAGAGIGGGDACDGDVFGDLCGDGDWDLFCDSFWD